MNRRDVFKKLAGLAAALGLVKVAAAGEASGAAEPVVTVPAKDLEDLRRYKAALEAWYEDAKTTFAVEAAKEAGVVSWTIANAYAVTPRLYYVGTGTDIFFSFDGKTEKLTPVMPDIRRA